MTLAALVAVMLAIGVALGVSGYGGFLVPPVLVWLGGLPDPRSAVTYALLAAVLPTLAGAVLYRRSHRTPWLLVATLGVGTLPGILLGHWLATSASDTALHVLIGASVVLAGVAMLRRGRPAPPVGTQAPMAGASEAASAAASEAAPGAASEAPSEARPDLPHRIVPISLGAGMLSGVAGVVVGVGGPLVTTPILLASGMTLTAAIGAGLANAVLVNVVGSLTLLGGVEVDPLLLTLVVVPQLLGVLVGVRLHDRIATVPLTRVIAAVAVMVGVLFVLQVVHP